MAELEELQDEEMGEILEYDEDELEEDDEEDESESEGEKEEDLLLEISTDNLPDLSPSQSSIQGSSQDETSMPSDPTMYELTQRSHKLERERRDLLDQLASLKETSLYTEHTLANDVSTQVMELNDRHCKEMEQLKRKLQQVELERESTQAENIYLNTRLDILQEEKELISDELEQCQDMIQTKVKLLQEKTTECDDALNKLTKSERKVSNLKKLLEKGEEDCRLATVSKQQLMGYQELEQSHRHLSEENKMLRERTDNIDLLTYQLQSLREKVSRLESEQETSQQLQSENQILKEKLQIFTVGESSENSNPLMSPSFMRLQLIHLQQKEVTLMIECSQLKTQVKIGENTLQRARNEISQLKEDIQKHKAEIENKIESIQKLERRVKFIAKERDGVVNVLHSYKLDGGADSILKEQVTELEASNARLNEKILEQAKELERCYTQLERRKMIQES